MFRFPQVAGDRMPVMTPPVLFFNPSIRRPGVVLHGPADSRLQAEPVFRDAGGTTLASRALRSE